MIEAIPGHDRWLEPAATIEDHLEECEFPETEICTCEIISKEEAESIAEERGIEDYYREKYGD